MILGFKTIHPVTKEPTGFVNKILQGKKIHSIREGNRWSEDWFIHFATGVRTKNYKQFHTATVKSVQDIVINNGHVIVEGIELNQHTIGLLAANDGFDSVEDFWNWFTEPVTGQIIHWTGYKY